MPQVKKSAAKAPKRSTKKVDGQQSQKTSSKKTAASSAAWDKQAAQSVEMVGSLIEKGFSLAEVGINFGIQLFTIGSERILGKIAGKAGLAAPAPGSAGQASAQPADSANNGEENSTPEVINRLPLYPGSTIQVPFSISNDAPDREKQISVALSSFTGAARGIVLGESNLSIAPATIQIGRMDFEKFCISGTVPASAPPDRYCGFVEVRGDETFNISVMLTIENQ